MHLGVLIRCAKSCNELIFEGADEPLRCITYVHSRRVQLVVDAIVLQ